MKKRRIYYLVLLIGLILTSSLVGIKTIQAQDLEDGYYRLGVDLWHAIDDKASMGNGSMADQAEIEVKDGEIFIYIESKLMEYASIQASLIDLYVDMEDGSYHRAQKGAYNLEIPGEPSPRPRVFKSKLVDLEEYRQILVNPKVDAMGKDPIKARLKLEIEGLEKIDQPSLKAQFENQDNKSPQSYIIKEENLILDLGQNPGQYDLQISQLNPRQIEEYKNILGDRQVIKIFQIQAYDPIEKIPKDFQDFDKLKNLVSDMGSYQMTYPYEDGLQVYWIDQDTKLVEAQSTRQEDKVLIKATRPGILALTKTDQDPVRSQVPISSQGPKTSQGQAQPKASQKPRPKAQKCQVQKPQVPNQADLPDQAPIASQDQGPQLSLEPTLGPSMVDQGQSQGLISHSQDPSPNLDQEDQKRESKGLLILIGLILVGVNIAMVFWNKRQWQEYLDQNLLREELKRLGDDK